MSTYFLLAILLPVPVYVALCYQVIMKTTPANWPAVTIAFAASFIGVLLVAIFSSRGLTRQSSSFYVGALSTIWIVTLINVEKLRLCRDIRFLQERSNLQLSEWLSKKLDI